MLIILAYFPLGGCVADVVSNKKKIISLLQSYSYISWIAQECIRITKELFSMCTSIKTTFGDMNTTK